MKNNNFSNSYTPDLDWSQVRETVKLIAVSVSQVESSVQKGDVSVHTLTEAFTDMVKHLDNIAQAAEDLEEGEAKTAIKMNCMMNTNKIHTSIIEFQFYDRMKQCLQHATENLMGLSHIIDNPTLLYNPYEWKKLQTAIRNGYSAESEKVMFDAILKGKSVTEAIAMAKEFEVDHSNDEDIELF